MTFLFDWYVLIQLKKLVFQVNEVTNTGTFVGAEGWFDQGTTQKTGMNGQSLKIKRAN